MFDQSEIILLINSEYLISDGEIEKNEQNIELLRSKFIYNQLENWYIKYL